MPDSPKSGVQDRATGRAILNRQHNPERLNCLLGSQSLNRLPVAWPKALLSPAYRIATLSVFAAPIQTRMDSAGQLISWGKGSHLMSEPKGIIRNHQSGNPANPKWNGIWKSTLPHHDPPQAGSDQEHPAEPQPASEVMTANGAREEVAKSSRLSNSATFGRQSSNEI